MNTEQNLERLALLAGAIVRNFDANDTPSIDAEILQATLLAPIEDEAPKHQATTARGALFQLLLAAGDISNLVGSEMDPDTLQKRHERIEGCIISALNFFERAYCLDRDEIGGSHFSYRAYVPEVWRSRLVRNELRTIPAPLS